MTSWFFKPNIHADAIEDLNGIIYSLLTLFNKVNLIHAINGSTTSLKTIVGAFRVKRKAKFLCGFNIRLQMLERANLVFHNKAIDGPAMKRLISRLIDHFGMAYI